MYEPGLRREWSGWRQGSLKAYNRLRPMFVLVLKILFHERTELCYVIFCGWKSLNLRVLYWVFPKKHNWSSRPLLPLSIFCSFISFLSDIYGVKSTSLFLFIPNSLTTASTKSLWQNFPNSAHIWVLLSSLHSNQPFLSPCPAVASAILLRCLVFIMPL